MTNFQRHIVLPALAPLLFFAVAATPVHVLGCRTRGLLALIIAFVSVLAGLFASIMGAKTRMKHDPSTRWWLASAVILVIPPIALLILA
jgi:hypothetical protein